jgi:hypothetical protein
MCAHLKRVACYTPRMTRARILYRSPVDADHLVRTVERDLRSAEIKVQQRDGQWGELVEIDGERVLVWLASPGARRITIAEYVGPAAQRIQRYGASGSRFRLMSRGATQRSCSGVGATQTLSFRPGPFCWRRGNGRAMATTISTCPSSRSSITLTTQSGISRQSRRGTGTSSCGCGAWRLYVARRLRPRHPAVIAGAGSAASSTFRTRGFSSSSRTVERGLTGDRGEELRSHQPKRVWQRGATGAVAGIERGKRRRNPII